MPPQVRSIVTKPILRYVELLQRYAGAGQGATAGMMPPSDSDDSDEEEAPKIRRVTKQCLFCGDHACKEHYDVFHGWTTE